MPVESTRTSNRGELRQHSRRRRLAWTGAAGVVVWALMAHAFARSCGLRCYGLAAVGNEMFTALAVLVLLAACLACGLAALDRLALPTSPFEELLFALLIGTGMLGTTLLLLAAAGLLEPIVLWLVMCAPVVPSRRRLFSALSALRQGFSRMAERRAPLATFSLVTVLLAAVYSGCRDFLPPTDWDSLMYHLEIPKEILRHGRLYVPVDNLHIAFVGLIHMLYLPLLAVGAISGPALLNSVFAVTLALFLLAAGERLYASSTGQLAQTVVWASTSILLVATTARVDVTLSVFLFAAEYAALLGLTEPTQRGNYMVLAGVLAGFSAGIKYSGVLYSGGILLMALPLAYRDPSMRRPLALAVLATAVAAAPFAIKNTLELGGPLYPYFTPRVLPPWLARLAGHRKILPPIPEAAFHAVGRARHHFNLRDFFLAPGTLTSEGEGVFYYANVLFLLLPAVVFVRRIRLSLLVAFPALFYVVAILGVSPSTNLRYLIPAYPALTLVSAEILRAVTERFRRRDWLRIGICWAALIPTLLGTTVVVKYFGGFPVLAGRKAAADYLEENSGRPARRMVNKWAKPGERVLMFFEGRGFYYKRPVLEDITLLNWPLLYHVIGKGACLPPHVAAFVLVNDEVKDYWLGKGLRLADINWDQFPAFAAKCLEQVDSIPGFRLFRVRDQPGQ
jgi:hypothetical protein